MGTFNVVDKTLHKWSFFMQNPPELAENFAPDDSTGLIGRVMKSYGSITPDNPNALKPLYTNDVYFEDPAHGIQGIAPLMDYFDNLFGNITSCEFKFHSQLTDGKDIFLTWTMSFQHKHLQKGKTVRVEGASYLKSRKGKIYFHRDYFDLGAMVYENVPLLGRLIQSIKKRLGK